MHGQLIVSILIDGILLQSACIRKYVYGLSYGDVFVTLGADDANLIIRNSATECRPCEQKLIACPFGIVRDRIQWVQPGLRRGMKSGNLEIC